MALVKVLSWEFWSLLLNFVFEWISDTVRLLAESVFCQLKKKTEILSSSAYQSLVETKGHHDLGNSWFWDAEQVRSLVWERSLRSVCCTIVAFVTRAWWIDNQTQPCKRKQLEFPHAWHFLKYSEKLENKAVARSGLCVRCLNQFIAQSVQLQTVVGCN